MRGRGLSREDYKRMGKKKVKEFCKEFNKLTDKNKTKEELAKIRKDRKNPPINRKFKSHKKTPRLSDMEWRDSRKVDKAVTEGGSKIVENASKYYFSIGEARIKQYLLKYEIRFEQEYKLCKNPKTGMHLMADFFIPHLNMVIEYDGYQHRTKPKTMTLKDFHDGQWRDQFKDQFCKRKGIRMVRIPSYNKDKINDILDELFSKHESEKENL